MQTHRIAMITSAFDLCALACLQGGVTADENEIDIGLRNSRRFPTLAT